METHFLGNLTSSGERRCLVHLRKGWIKGHFFFLMENTLCGSLQSVTRERERVNIQEEALGP